MNVSSTFVQNEDFALYT